MKTHKRRKDYRLKRFKTNKELIDSATRSALTRSAAQEDVAKVAEEEMRKMKKKAFFKRKLEEGLRFKD